METPSSEASPKPCSRCGGFQWLSVSEEGSFSSKAVPCPDCRSISSQDYFADLVIASGNQQAIRLAREFAAAPPGWLVIVGEAGTGKTRLLNAVVSQWRGASRTAMTSAQLLDVWRQALDEEKFNATFNGYCNTPAFALDDLGAEKPTEWGQERLTMFLDHRYGRAMPTIIATNYDRAELSRRLGERIADRVFDRGTGLVKVVSLNVPSFRSGASSDWIAAAKRCQSAGSLS